MYPCVSHSPRDQYGENAPKYFFTKKKLAFNEPKLAAAAILKWETAEGEGEDGSPGTSEFERRTGVQTIADENTLSH